MNKFKKVLNEELDALSIGSAEAQGKMDQVREIKRELNSALERVSELQMELRHAKEELNIELAKSLRKRMPKASIRLDDGGCSVGYRSTNLSCKPDVDNGIWAFEPNKYGRSFTRRFGPALQLNNKIDPLADAIVQYFSRYKSLL